MASFGFKSEVFQVSFNKRGWRAALNREMKETTKEAARKWLTVVTGIIPTWSRASLATFSKLAASVGFPIPFGSVASTAPGDRSSLGKTNSDGGLMFEKESWHFFYETDLQYLVWNEFNVAVKGDGSGIYSSLKRPTPYRFQQAGANEFESFAREVKFPNPGKFIKGKKI